MTGAPEHATPQPRWHLWLALLIGAVASAPALLNAPVYDDELLIFSNAFAHDASHLGENLTRDFFYASANPAAAMGYYRPAMKLAFMLEYQLFGARPFGYHGLSIAAWLGVIALGALLARRLGAAPSVVGLGAALSASHPVCGSAVSTITSQSDLFVVAAMLGSGYAYLRFREQAGRGYLFAALLLQALALGCKEIAVLTPVLWLAIELARAPVLSLRACMRRELAAVLALCTLYFGVRVALQVMPVHVARSGGELGALVTAAKVTCSGLLRAFAPSAWLPLVHAQRPEPTLLAVATWLLPALALLGVSLVLFVRHAALRPWIALLWAPLLPLALGESMIHTTDDTTRITISDRWLVLSAVAASYGVAALLMLAREHLRPALRIGIGLASGALVLTQLLLALEETASYASENARVVHIADLYREHGVREPYAVEVMLAADGVRAEAKNDPRAAALAYARLAALAPNDVLRHYNLAVMLMRAGETQRAYDAAYLAYHTRSRDGRVQLEPNDSWSRRRPERAFLLAQLSEQLGDRAGALRYFRECAAQRADLPGVQAALARLAAP